MYQLLNNFPTVSNQRNKSLEIVLDILTINRFQGVTQSVALSAIGDKYMNFYLLSICNRIKNHCRSKIILL